MIDLYVVQEYMGKAGKGTKQVWNIAKKNSKSLLALLTFVGGLSTCEAYRSIRSPPVREMPKDIQEFYKGLPEKLRPTHIDYEGDLVDEQGNTNPDGTPDLTLKFEKLSPASRTTIPGHRDKDGITYFLGSNDQIR